MTIEVNKANYLLKASYQEHEFVFYQCLNDQCLQLMRHSDKSENAAIRSIRFCYDKPLSWSIYRLIGTIF